MGGPGVEGLAAGRQGHIGRLSRRKIRPMWLLTDWKLSVYLQPILLQPHGAEIVSHSG